MIVQPDIQLKELRAATSGELVRFEWERASALAIVMRQTDQSTVCAFLETNGNTPSPFFLSTSIEGLVCISFGKEWLLDLVFDANTFPGNDQYLEKYGVIHVGEGAVAINLNRPPNNIRMSAGAFDLKTFKTVDVQPRTYAPVTSWKIWHTAIEKHQANAKPLFAFTAS